MYMFMSIYIYIYIYIYKPLRAQLEVATSLGNYALAIAPSGRLEEAEKCFNEALEIQQDVCAHPKPPKPQTPEPQTQNTK